MSSNGAVYTDPTKRHDFVLFFDVTQGNPNGDPDAENLPRVDPETMHGIVTDVCIKRKVRDYVATVLGRPIFIQSQVALNTLYFRKAKDAGAIPIEMKFESEEERKLLDSDDEALVEWFGDMDAEGFDWEPETRTLSYLGEARKKKDFFSILTTDLEPEKTLAKKLDGLASRLQALAKDTPKISKQMRKTTKELLCEEFFDIRMFGAVLTAGTNAGQVRGPMQLTFGRSLDPILPLNPTITRVAITKEADRSRKQTEMGRKPFVPYGLYRTHGFYSPFLAQKTTEHKAEVTEADLWITRQDLADFWEALERMFEHDHSASRGEMCTRGVYIFTHQNPRGDTASHRLFKLVEDQIKTSESRPRSIAAYGTLPTQTQVQEAARRLSPDITVRVLAAD